MVANRTGVEVGYLAASYPGLLGHLYKLCRERLDAAEGRIEELAKRVEESKPDV